MNFMRCISFYSLINKDFSNILHCKIQANILNIRTWKGRGGRKPLEFCVVGNLRWYSYCGSRFWFWTLLCWVSLSGDSDRFLQEQFSWIYSTTYSFPCWSSGQEWKKIHVNECIILKKKLNLLKQMIFPAYIRLRMKMTFSQFWHTIKKIIICTWHLFTFIWALQWDIPLFTTLISVF